jgi:hypothetical protein
MKRPETRTATRRCVFLKVLFMCVMSRVVIPLCGWSFVRISLDTSTYQRGYGMSKEKAG